MSTKFNAADKTERLLNLVICLLYTRKPLSKAKIRDAVPQYGSSASDEAFDRMFERDKDELRELGIPLVTEPYDILFDDEPGYRIDRREYALPEISFAPDELAVLGLASRAWTQASLAGPAAQALRKLEAAGVERDDSSLIGIVPMVRTVEPAFEAVKDAVLARTAMAFTYRTAGTSQVATRPAVGHRLLARSLVPHRVRHGPAGVPGIPAGPDPGRGRHRGQARVVRGARRSSAERDDQVRGRCT